MTLRNAEEQPSRGEATLAVIAGRLPYGFITNQTTSTTTIKTMTPQTTGVICFELPLRGESLAA
jgi:hypothetical protein